MFLIILWATQVQIICMKFALLHSIIIICRRLLILPRAYILHSLFALKDRKTFNDDIVLYVLKLRDMEDYTQDIKVADEWLKDLNVYVSFLMKTVSENLSENLLKIKGEYSYRF